MPYAELSLPLACIMDGAAQSTCIKEKLMNRQMLKQIEQMQKQMLKAQEELGNSTVEGTAGGGAITVTMNGHREITAIQIAPEVVDPDDVEMLQDMLMAAINDASRKAQELAESKLGGLTGGMKIPGLF